MIKGGIFLTLSLIYEDHKSVWTRARPLSRKQMWEPRALAFLQVVVLGCGPDLCPGVRNDFLGSIHSRVTTWSELQRGFSPACYQWAGSLTALALSQEIGSHLLDLCTNGAFLFFWFLFLSLSFVKYAALKRCLNACVAKPRECHFQGMFWTTLKQFGNTF